MCGAPFKTRAATQLAAAWCYVDGEQAASVEVQLDCLGGRIHGAARG